MQKNIQTQLQAWRRTRQHKQHRLNQGRLTANEAATRLPDSGEMPLARLRVSHGSMPTVYTTADQRGHLLIVTPPDRPWREQLTLTLTHWPGAALVVDPDGRLYQKTAAVRQNEYGPVYPVPGYRLSVQNFLRLWRPEVAFQLHQHLMPPALAAASAEDDSVARTVSLFCAVGMYVAATRHNPFQLLLDIALTDMLTALAALETVPQARLHVRAFTKGQPPQLAIYDAATVQSFAWFSQQLWRYQAAYTLFATPEDKKDVIPERWYSKQSTLYLTYPVTELADMAGLVAAVVNSQLVAHQTYGQGQPLLLVLEASLASRLPHFAQFLTTAADYGITVVLTAPSLSALDTLTPTGSGTTLAAQFAHQLWYAPRDRETAVYMTTRYGTRLNAASEAVPELTPEEILAWPEEQLLLVTERERPYVVLGQTLAMPPDFPQRQPPWPPAGLTPPRSYDQWLPDLPDLSQQMTAFLMANGAIPIPTKDAEVESERDETAVAKAQTTSESTDEPALVVPDPLTPAAPDEPEGIAEEGAAAEKSLKLARSHYR